MGPYLIPEAKKKEKPPASETWWHLFTVSVILAIVCFVYVARGDLHFFIFGALMLVVAVMIAHKLYLLARAGEKLASSAKEKADDDG